MRFCLYEYIQVYKYLVWKGIRSILRLGRGGGCKLSETDDIATGMIMVYGSQCPQAGFEDIKAYRREERGTIYHKAFNLSLIDFPTCEILFI